MANIEIKDGAGTTRHLKASQTGSSSSPFIPEQAITFAASSAIDAFGRLRVSNPETIFDSKQLFDNLPLLWDDSQVSGSGTTSVWTKATASSVMAVSASTAGRRIRQTFRRFNYQPAKSQLFFMTGTLGEVGGGAGITRSMGLYDDDNGIFMQDNEGVVTAVCRSSTTGSVIDNSVVQSAWNMDKLDGSGESGLTLDGSKSQILFCDFEWLGVGSVRIGFVINNMLIYVHEFQHANLVAGVYMSTPNLPFRYEIENDGSGAASELEHICSSIISEGGVQDIGVLRYASTDGTHVDANTANTIYAVVGIRLKTTHIGATIKNIRKTMLSETADDFEWLLIWNPTVNGTFTYNDETDSALQVARGATINTVTGGYKIDGGFSSSTTSSSDEISNALILGSAIDGTRDEMVLCVRPLSGNADIQGSLTSREVS